MKRSYVEATADWDDVRDMYGFDSRNVVRLLPKITADHINPIYEKMKVSYAAQVFSKSFGIIMLFCSKMKLLPRDCSGTAYILLFINNVFDSLNGGGKPVPNSFRASITDKNKAKYFKFWEYAIASLENMTFVDKDGDTPNNRSTVIQKLVSTIRGYMELTIICFSLGIESISLRQMNQDALENFFGSIRSVSSNSKAPVPSQFRTGYTTLILNNLTSKHSVGGNCEEDDNTPLLKFASSSRTLQRHPAMRLKLPTKMSLFKSLVATNKELH